MRLVVGHPPFYTGLPPQQGGAPLKLRIANAELPIGIGHRRIRSKRLDQYVVHVQLAHITIGLERRGVARFERIKSRAQILRQSAMQRRIIPLSLNVAGAPGVQFSLEYVRDVRLEPLGRWARGVFGSA